ncbi:hypothetical protein [Streptomyces boncukensis]|uniref:Secreted protein n=1 Tax=Streptomyces boncukensis TaxID=2711219 RepID=A0A6G4WYB8_9ACTN|nr:hypothetical protein [Streptomyces boncukensis]NGO69630.1 hypothetical protein [Streptomyces boncukensis]
MQANRITAVAATALAGTLALGAAGIATADHGSDHREKRQQAPGAPQPGADRPEADRQLAQQAETLQDTAAVSDAVGRVLTDVNQAKDGKLSPYRAQRHAHRVAKALTELRTAVTRQAVKSRPLPAAELTTKAASALQASTAKLLRISTAGDERKTRSAARETLVDTVNVVTAANAYGKIPAATLEGLTGKKAPAPSTEPA